MTQETQERWLRLLLDLMDACEMDANGYSGGGGEFGDLTGPVFEAAEEALRLAGMERKSSADSFADLLSKPAVTP